MESEAAAIPPGEPPPPEQKQPTTKETALGCGCLAVIVLLAVWLLKGCFSSGESPKHATMGISYSQMMGHGFNDLFDMKKSSDVDGQERHMGESRMGVGMLELIGDKDDLSKATLILGMPRQDSPIITENAGLALGFLGNTDTTWTGAERTTWIQQTARQFTGQNGEASVIRGKNRIKLEVLQPHGITLSVEPSQ